MKKTIVDDALTVVPEAIEILRNYSKEREDGKHELLTGRDIVIYRNCRKNYTRPSIYLRNIVYEVICVLK